MSNRLWGCFIQDDVEQFKRFLANATFVGPRAAGSTGGVSSTATILSSKAGSPGTMIASSPNAPRSKKNPGSSPATPVSDRSAFPRKVSTLTRADVNARDSHGRTLLHHVASSSKPTAPEFARALLQIPFIDIYVQDLESGWTALHRALYAGNATIALALMARDTQDTMDFSKVGNSSHPSGGLIKIKDFEGYSPFDVFGSTIRLGNILRFSEHYPASITGTASGSDAFSNIASYGEDEDVGSLPRHTAETVDILADEVFTLGSNKNLNLGLGDQDDRQFPERISLKRPDHLLHRFSCEYRQEMEDLGLEETIPSSKSTRFPTLITNKPLTIKDIVMSKLHTAIITNDPEANLFMCGFGPGGRLGTGDESTRFTFACIESGGLEGRRVVSAALGQDHSLAITEHGEIFSWGSNKFGQLGYSLPRSSNINDVPIQATPRQIFNPFKKETILGAAASSVHSVVFSTSGLYTFGKNEGQLGLVDSDARSLDVQTTPRRVGASLFNCPIKMVSAIDRATSVLLQNHEVWVFASYGYSKLSLRLEVTSSFIKNSFMTTRYDTSSNRVVKLTSGGNTICALSSSGDVFTVQVNHSDSSSASSSTTNPVKIRNSLAVPVRAWSVKKPHMAASDVDVGQDGSIIICTKSGSAWRKERRTKDKKGALKDFKFARIPGLSRAVAVRSNAFGAYAVAQRDCEVTRQISIDRGRLWADVSPLAPFTIPRLGPLDSHPGLENPIPFVVSAIKSVQRAIHSSGDIESHWLPAWTEGTIWVTTSLSDFRLPVHEFILAGRSLVLSKALDAFHESYYFSVPGVFDIGYGKDGHPQICLQDVDPLTILGVVFFLYTDIYDYFVYAAMRSDIDVNHFGDVRIEIMGVASQLGLPTLERAARLKVAPKGSLTFDMAHAINRPSFFDSGDLFLQLKDDTIKVHSPIVCARCPFFDTIYRGNAGGRWLELREPSPTQRVLVNLKHIDRSTFDFVRRYLYADTDEHLFDEVRTNDLDDFIDLVLDVMFVADELMIDRLCQVCQSMLGRFVTTRNVCYLLNSVAPCPVTLFKSAALEYICLNLEAMLANGYLNDLDPVLLGELDMVCREKQLFFCPVSRRINSEDWFLEKHPEIVRTVEADKQRRIDDMTLPSRTGPLEPSSARKAKTTAGRSPMLNPRQSTGDLMFQMDDEASMSPSGLKGKGPTRGLRFTEGIPDNGSYPDSPEAASLGNPSFLDSQMSPSQGSLLAQSPSETRANALSQKHGLALSSDPSSAPWTSPNISSSKKDLKDIMGEASQSRVSNLTLGMADRRESSASFVPKISQKERKRLQQQQMQEQLAAQQKAKDSPQNPWQKPASASPASRPSLDPLPGQSAQASGSGVSPQRSMTMRQTVAGTPPPKSKPVVTPVQMQRRTVSGNPQLSQPKPPTPGPLTATPNLHPTSPQPAIQSIRHIPRPDPTQSYSPSSGSFSLSTILLQQQTEKEAIREAASAKHKMQEIQAEQEFQQWWDQESKRVQGLIDPEPNEPRSGKSARGGKAPGAANGPRKRRSNKSAGDGAAAPEQKRASASTPSNGTPKAKQKRQTQTPAEPSNAPKGNHAGDVGNSNARRGGGTPRRGRRKDNT
jgi:alpha-tubulin suppressor-like RCC1 family protein